MPIYIQTRTSPCGCPVCINSLYSSLTLLNFYFQFQIWFYRKLYANMPYSKRSNKLIHRETKKAILFDLCVFFLEKGNTAQLFIKSILSSYRGKRKQRNTLETRQISAERSKEPGKRRDQIRRSSPCIAWRITLALQLFGYWQSLQLPSYLPCC